jgi:hypothetical protein
METIDILPCLPRDVFLDVIALLSPGGGAPNRSEGGFCCAQFQCLG